MSTSLGQWERQGGVFSWYFGRKGLISGGLLISFGTVISSSLPLPFVFAIAIIVHFYEPV
jgi:hypothetical protein